MSKLKELVSKGVRLIVTDVPDGGAAPPPLPEVEEFQTSPRPKVVLPSPRKPGTPKTLSASDVMGAPPAPRTTSSVPATVDDFDAVFKEAGIVNPGHGYGIGKIAEMLESPRLKALGREVKAAAVMAALEAAGVELKDVIRDAVARDEALDAFESAKERELAELRAKNEVRAQGVQEEIDAFLRAKNAELEELKGATKAAESDFITLRARKRVEEQRLHDTIAHFIEGAENPISTSSTQGGAPPSGTSGS